MRKHQARQRPNQKLKMAKGKKAARKKRQAHYLNSLVNPSRRRRKVTLTKDRRGKELKKPIEATAGKVPEAIARRAQATLQRLHGAAARTYATVKRSF